MVTQAIFPPPQWRIQDLSHVKVVKSGRFGQTRYMDAETKPMYDPPVFSIRQSCDLCKSALPPPFFLNEWFLQETFFDKIDVEIHVSKSTYLFLVSCEIKYATYIANQHYKSLWRGGELPQSASLHSRDNISCESRDQEQNKADQSSS
jgi:hypothetical protein